MNFFEQVYEVVKKIPKGKVMTYGGIAEAIGSKDARKVGWALHALRHAQGKPIVPCHRIVNKDGRLAPGYAFGGPDEQKVRLIAEGIKFNEAGNVDAGYIMRL